MQYFQPLIQFTASNFNFTKEDEILVGKYFQTENFKKNEVILSAGEICQKLYFIKKGLIRTFHIGRNGTEFTRLIVQENDFCTILLSLVEKVASPANIQALENTEVFAINKLDFQEFISQSESAKKMYTKILEDFQNFQISRLEFLTTLSPQEKVAQFLTENSDLDKRISDKIISTYLQITPETYSRCKKKITS